jgi:NAD(P)-dependent dehydrogenase (short-subunit alcohol dehydrogenase family)
MRIAGSVVLVTGANRGIGRAFVAGLAAAGAAKIYAASRKPAATDDPRIVAVRLDITDAAQVAQAAAACGDVDILVNNAGVATFSPLLGAASVAGARLEMETNYFGTLSMTRAFAPILARRGGGAVVNILSVASWRISGQLGSYSVSKMAELGLTQATRIELRAQGTLVIGVHPGFVDTDMVAHVSAEKTTSEEVVAATLAALAAGETEVVPGATAKRIKAALLENPALLEAEAQKIWDEKLLPPKD